MKKVQSFWRGATLSITPGNNYVITAAELTQIPVFAGLDESLRQKLAQKAADIRVESGDWVIREGEEPRFFVVLEGSLQVVKDIVGQRRELEPMQAGEFFGEIPIFLGTANLVSVQAKSRCRLARFDRQQLQELIRDSSAGATIFQTMKDRLLTARHYAEDAPISRVLLVGSPYDADCRGIRSFLSANRVQYEWLDSELEPERASSCLPPGHDGIAAVVDGTICLLTPTVRAVADALGLQTMPRDKHYDVVIAGAGPAGMAAGVYGASEGLKVLIVERSAAGGQAGTSSRIENYLGFPSGISGDELTERAVKQARRFGSEIAVTRSIEAILTTVWVIACNWMAESALGLAPFCSRPESIGIESKFPDWTACLAVECSMAPLVRRPPVSPGRRYSWLGEGTPLARRRSSSRTMRLR